jgi:hypothetical protein
MNVVRSLKFEDPGKNETKDEMRLFYPSSSPLFRCASRENSLTINYDVAKKDKLETARDYTTSSRICQSENCACYRPVSRLWLRM